MDADKSLRDYLSGVVPFIKLSTPPSPAALRALKELDNLGVLTERVVWSLLGNASVDPMGIIRTLRASKTTLKLVEDEIILDSSVVFRAGGVLNNLHKVSIHVDIGTNDVSVLSRVDPESTQSTYFMLYWVRGDKVFEQFSDLPAGQARLDKFLELMQSYIDHAMAYS